MLKKETRKKQSPLPTPVQPKNEEVSLVTVLVPVVSPCKQPTANNTITLNTSELLDTFLKYTYPQNYKSTMKANKT